MYGPERIEIIVKLIIIEMPTLIRRRRTSMGDDDMNADIQGVVYEIIVINRRSVMEIWDQQNL
jgi:hypothetical protein